MRKRTFAGPVLCVMLLGTPALAVTITVVPPNPVAGDQVQLNVEGLQWCYSQGDCYGVIAFVGCGQGTEPQTFTVSVEDYWWPCCRYPCSGGCNADCVILECFYGTIGVCDLGKLPAGHYSVLASVAETPGDPRSSTFTFDVSGPTPIAKRSWGNIKLLYR